MRKFLICLSFVATVSMIFMSLRYFQNDVIGIMNGKEVAHSSVYRFVLKSHILCGMIAMLSGPFQFIKSLRQRFLRVHKAIGYIYALSILVSGLAGLIVAQFAYGGVISVVGFTVLSLLWLTLTFLGIYFVVIHNIDLHKFYMLGSMALTFATIPQRTMLLLTPIFGIEFLVVYRFSAWLPWLLNLSVAYYFWSKKLKLTQRRPAYV